MDKIEINDQSLGYLRDLLKSALSPDNATRKNAEAHIQSSLVKPGFPVLLLTLISAMTTSKDPLEVAIRQSASVLFKNLVKNHWSPEDETSVAVSAVDKHPIKTHVIDLMTSAPADVQKQLAESVTIISKYDFPQNWANLLPDLVTKLASDDILVIKGVMLTANSIMKRYRYVFKSDELFSEILVCLEAFALPLLQQYQRYGGMVSKYAQSPELPVVFETLRLMTRIFYSLNWQDIPEFFEDNVALWMNEFAKYLSYNGGVSGGDENEPGPIEALQAAILENLNLYTSKYEEVFEPHLPKFTEMAWNLLLQVGSQPRYDQLATGALKFLTSVCSKQANAHLFNDAILRDIIEKIVVKNITATESDEELFEDNPADYIRKDMEGSDQDTRRRCAIELVRALMKYFAPQITQLCLGYVTTLLEKFSSTNDWKYKDIALHLVLAVSVQNSNALIGATELNPAVNILSIFESHVLPEIHDMNVNRSPIVKADSIKLICVFRSHFPPAFLVSLIPHLIRFLRSTSVVTQTYSAICLEKFLCLKDAGAGTPRIKMEDIQPVFEPLFSGLFSIIENPEFGENEYAMKCIMRALVLIGSGLYPVAEIVLHQLTKSLEKVCKNPVNPNYNHYLFESLAVVVRSLCGDGTNPSELQLNSCSKLEVLLFPIFQAVLSQDVAEFIPYVFQLFAQLLGARRQGSGLSDAYRALFVPLLSPALWERKGNIPALIELFKAYVSRGMSEIIASNHFTGVLGIFQKLLSLKSTEVHAFALLNTIYSFCPHSTIAPFCTTIFNLLLHKLQEASKTNKSNQYAKLFIHSICVFSGMYGGDQLFQLLESLTPGLVGMIVLNVWSQNRVNCASRKDDKKHILIGGTKLLLESPVTDKLDVWLGLLKSLVSVFSSATEAAKLEIQFDDEGEGKEFDTTYSKLSFSGIVYIDSICANEMTGQEYFSKALSTFTHNKPGTYNQLIQNSLDENEKNSLYSTLHQFQVNLV